MKNRTVLSLMKQKADTRLGRLIALTGARQTGKTTLVKAGFPECGFVSLEDPIVRPDFTALSAAQWYQRYPRVILDEIQKAPSIVESVKAVYDRYPDSRSILLGSSQILLMDQIRESLAGRVTIMELYPLTIPEMMTDSWHDPVVESRLVQYLESGDPDMLVSGIPQQSDRYARAVDCLDHYLEFGGMPVVSDITLSREDRYGWLQDYLRTYLQRDLRDLAKLRDLVPYVRMLRALGGLAGGLLNTSELARLAGVTHRTINRFVTYLEISYQVIQLQPWFRNRNKRLSKAAKIHFLDPGIQRALLNRRGRPSGTEFEGAIIAEINKQTRNLRLPVDFYHLRTVNGREVDLLIETESGYVPIEVKYKDRVSNRDARHLRRLQEILDKPVLQALVLSNDSHIRDLGDGVMGIPAGWALGG
ncbi:MAG: ATP-binding protein [Gemmatimonadetes bacterium]|nr:ATP-binding protein [Gemmatimonadota bacterium]